ncbi:hypothetical protein MCUN1_002371 [Malassezia cuniculi]|uniref:Uncharacterized protein n=1 Tax=Malassezia cuniculi TaxID=948313 RepID=A0AAF0EZL5_9BASI|nr:hypothetical protein MCUN1_002371 [Malassezia cuniculi]
MSSVPEATVPRAVSAENVSAANAPNGRPDPEGESLVLFLEYFIRSMPSSVDFVQAYEIVSKINSARRAKDIVRKVIYALDTGVPIFQQRAIRFWTLWVLAADHLHSNAIPPEFASKLNELISSNEIENVVRADMIILVGVCVYHSRHVPLLDRLRDTWLSCRPRGGGDDGMSLSSHLFGEPRDTDYEFLEQRGITVRDMFRADYPISGPNGPTIRMPTSVPGQAIMRPLFDFSVCLEYYSAPRQIQVEPTEMSPEHQRTIAMAVQQYFESLGPGAQIPSCQASRPTDTPRPVTRTGRGEGRRGASGRGASRNAARAANGGPNGAANAPGGPNGPPDGAAGSPNTVSNTAPVGAPGGATGGTPAIAGAPGEPNGSPPGATGTPPAPPTVPRGSPVDAAGIRAFCLNAQKRADELFSALCGHAPNISVFELNTMADQRTLFTHLTDLVGRLPDTEPVVNELITLVHDSLDRIAAVVELRNRLRVHPMPVGMGADAGRGRLGRTGALVPGGSPGRVDERSYELDVPLFRRLLDGAGVTMTDDRWLEVVKRTTDTLVDYGIPDNSPNYCADWIQVMLRVILDARPQPAS